MGVKDCVKKVHQNLQAKDAKELFKGSDELTDAELKTIKETSNDLLTTAEASRLGEALVQLQYIVDDKALDMASNFNKKMAKAGEIKGPKKRAAKELALQDANRAALARHKVDVDSALKDMTNYEHIYQESFKGKSAEGLLSLFERSNKPIKNGNRNLDVIWRNNYMRESSVFIEDLNSKGLLKLFKKGNFNKEIISEVYDRSIEGFVSKASKEVIEMADAVGRFNDRLFNIQKEAGSTIKYRANYIFSETLDNTKVVADSNSWANDMLNALDLDKSYNHGVTRKQAYKILMKEAEDMEDVGGINRWMGGVRQKVYKSGKAYAAINEKWGNKDLFEGLDNAAKQATKKAALTEIFSNEPVKAYNRIRKIIEKTSSNQKNIVQDLRKIDDAADLFSGVGNRPGEGAAGFAYQAARTANVLASAIMLGKVPKAVLLDTVQMMGHLHTLEGGNVITNTGRMIYEQVRSLGVKGSDLSADIKVAMDESFGHLLELSNGGAYVPGQLHKGVDFIFKWTGAKALTKHNRKTAAGLTMRSLQRNIRQGSKGRNLQQVRTLEKIGLTKQDIDFIRSSGLADNSLSLSPVAVDRLGGGKALSDKLRYFYQDSVDSMSPIPDAKTLRRLGRHIPQDDPKRFAYELGTLFQSTLLRGGDTLAGTMRAYSPNGNIVSYNSMAIAASLAVRGGMVSYLAETAMDAAVGKDYKELTPESYVNHMVKSGFAGLYVDLLFKLAVDREGLGSPAVSMLSKTVTKAFNDKDGAVIDSLFNKNSLAGSNIWLWPAFQTHILNDEVFKPTKQPRKTVEEKNEARKKRLDARRKTWQ